MKVIYKEVSYEVVNPGKLDLSIDQLSGDKMPIRYNSYIRKKYELTPRDYYTIVVFLGDESKIPECEVQGCHEKKRFRNLRDGLSDACCVPHAHTLENIRHIESGNHNFLGEEGFELRSRVARDRVESGTHPFLKENSQSWRSSVYLTQLERGTYKLQTPEVREKANRSRRKYPDGPYPKKKATGPKPGFLLSRPNHPFHKKSSRIKAHRTVFINRGNPDDKCYLYIAEMTDNDSVIKIGATDDPKRRRKMFSEKVYKSLEVVAESNRLEIANLEYSIKLNFIDFSVNNLVEVFPMDLLSEILDYIHNNHSDKLKFNDYPEKE